MILIRDQVVRIKKQQRVVYNSEVWTSLKNSLKPTLQREVHCDVRKTLTQLVQSVIKYWEVINIIKKLVWKLRLSSRRIRWAVDLTADSTKEKGSGVAGVSGRDFTCKYVGTLTYFSQCQRVLPADLRVQDADVMFTQVLRCLRTRHIGGLRLTTTLVAPAAHSCKNADSPPNVTMLTSPPPISTWWWRFSRDQSADLCTCEQFEPQLRRRH